MYFLGIDGGGSKTTVAMVDEAGNLISIQNGGPSNPISTSMDLIETTMERLFANIKYEHGEKFSQIKSVCAGIAGTENSTLKERLFRLLKSKFSHDTHVQLSHDALTALYSGTNGDPGIVNIAGTGSITFGVTVDKIVVRSGGWGYLLDHTGSGYGIGRIALKKVFDAYDGLISSTLLTERILKRFGVSSPPELIPFIYESNDSRSRIASICEDVFEAVRSGDREAESIVGQAATEISKNIAHLIEGHFQSSSRLKVVLTGSVFKSSDLLLPHLKKNLPTGVQLVQPTSPPVAGAIIESYQSIYGTCPEQFVVSLHHSFAKEV